MKYNFEFVKYQGCGNDFILRDEFEGPKTPDQHRGLLARKLTDRHFGIGADGILFVEKSKGVDGSMRLFEVAGNEADMCGNGLRCVGAYLMKKLGKDSVDVMTGDGVKHIEKVGSEYRTDMGVVRDRRRDLEKYIVGLGSPDDSLLHLTVDILGEQQKGSLLNSGEPHLVFVSEDLSSVEMTRIGEWINKDRARFPEYVNVNFIQVVGPHEVRIRTYERGVFGETMACGTGATACAAAALLLGLVKPGKVNVTTNGGTIEVELGPDRRATMTGPAVEVFRGRAEVEI